MNLRDTFFHKNHAHKCKIYIYVHACVRLRTPKCPTFYVRTAYAYRGARIHILLNDSARRNSNDRPKVYNNMVIFLPLYMVEKHA